jgi:diguanylate cyclase (GGDEF)-like protein
MDRLASPEQRRDLRLSLARRQIPEVLVWAGALTLAFGVVNYVTLPDESAWSWATNLVFGPLFVLLGWALRRDVIPASLAPTVWASCSLLLVVMLALVFHEQPSAANLAYIVAVMTAYGPITHAWLPFWVSGGAMLAVVGVTFAASPGVDPIDDALVCAAALLISSILLRLRMKALDELAESQVLLDHQATYDPLTDVLNRNGLERAMPSVSAAALRAGAEVLVWFVDVRGLKRANDEHGHAYGDAVIRATADALHACVRANDLVARWGGDEFVVLGEGAAGSAEELNVRMNAALAKGAGLSPPGPISVTVGFACGPGDEDVTRIIARADADMYRRRVAPFAGEPS